MPTTLQAGQDQQRLRATVTAAANDGGGGTGDAEEDAPAAAAAAVDAAGPGDGSGSDPDELRSAAGRHFKDPGPRRRYPPIAAADPAIVKERCAGTKGDW
jgi:hypothetical protein